MYYVRTIIMLPGGRSPLRFDEGVSDEGEARKKYYDHLADISANPSIVLFKLVLQRAGEIPWETHILKAQTETEGQWKTQLLNGSI